MTSTACWLLLGAIVFIICANLKEKEIFEMENKDIKFRLKSWATWLSVLGAVGIILQATGVLEKWGLTGEGWNAIITALGSILVGFGILNNPTDRHNF